MEYFLRFGRIALFLLKIPTVFFPIGHMNFFLSKMPTASFLIGHIYKYFACYTQNHSFQECLVGIKYNFSFTMPTLALCSGYKNNIFLYTPTLTFIIKKGMHLLPKASGFAETKFLKPKKGVR